MPSLIPRTPWARRLVYELIYIWPGVHRSGTFNPGFAPARPGIQSKQIQLYAELLDQIPPDADWRLFSCLELAAGCGGGLLYLKAHRAPKETIGIDHSHIAAWRSRQLGLDVRQGDAARLPFEEGRFDCVFCLDALNYFAVGPALQEAFRVLKPGGHLLLGEAFHGTVGAAGERFRRIGEAAGFELQHFRDVSGGVRRSIEENSASTGASFLRWLPAFIRNRLMETLSLEGSERLDLWRSGANCFVLAALKRPAIRGPNPQPDGENLTFWQN